MCIYTKMHIHRWPAPTAGDGQQEVRSLAVLTKHDHTKVCVQAATF